MSHIRGDEWYKAHPNVMSGNWHPHAVMVEGVPAYKHPMHRQWRSMISRCENPKDREYEQYAGRGITVYGPWHDFKTYVTQLHSEIGVRPSKKHSLDRIDNNKGYEPGNVRWATARQQALNTTANSDTPYVLIGPYKNRKSEYQITISMTLGIFSTEQDAITWRDKFYAEFGNDLKRMTEWADVTQQELSPMAQSDLALTA